MTTERVVINMPRWLFDKAVLTALERDTGKMPIMGEIVRILKIKQEHYNRTQRAYNARCANLVKARAYRGV